MSRTTLNAKLGFILLCVFLPMIWAIRDEFPRNVLIHQKLYWLLNLGKTSLDTKYRSADCRLLAVYPYLCFKGLGAQFPRISPQKSISVPYSDGPLVL